MQKIRKTENGIETVKVLKIYNGVIFYDTRTDLHKLDGFYEIIRPPLNANESYGTLDLSCLDDENMTATYPIVEMTQEELDARLIAETKLQREELLKQGVIVDGVWFNENYLGNFVNAINLIERAGGTQIEWKDDLDNWVTMTIEEASLMALQAMGMIQQIYKDN